MKERKELNEYFEIDRNIKNMIKEIKPNGKDVDALYMNDLLEGIYKIENCFYKMAKITEREEYNENIHMMLKNCRVAFLKVDRDKQKVEDLYEGKIEKKNKELREFINSQINNNNTNYEEAFSKVESINDILTFYHFCVLNKLSFYFIDRIEEKGMKRSYGYKHN